MSASAGCSTLFVKGPPANWQQRAYFDCSEGKGWVAWDGLSATSSAVAAVIFAAAPLTDEQGVEITGEDRAVNVALNLVAGALYLSSAVSGNKKVNQCRAAKEQHALGRVSGGAGAGIVPHTPAPRYTPAPDASPGAAPSRPRVPTLDVPYDALEALRLGGDPRIPVPERVRAQMLRTGQRTIQAEVKMCVNTDGKVGLLDIVKSSGFSLFDGQLLITMRTWKFEPYSNRGTLYRACTQVPVSQTVEPPAPAPAPAPAQPSSAPGNAPPPSSPEIQ